MSVIVVVGVAALGTVVVAWLGYPLVLAVLPTRRGRQGDQSESLPSVTVAVATRDDPRAVVARVEDLRAATYAHALLDVVVAVDVSSPWSVTEYQKQLGSAARTVAGDAPGGKAATLNAAARASIGDVLVFADTAQRFAVDAIRLLVGRLVADPTLGAVSGGYEAHHGGSPILRWFWQFERLLRRGEARVHSIVVVTGAIYAMRRVLWSPLPARLICDDLWVPLHLILRGYRVGYCEEALATDSRRFTQKQEFRRKVRTLTGILQLCVWMPRVLLPLGNPVWIQFVCHKLLRVATPFLLMLAGITVIPSVLVRHGSAFQAVGGIALGAILLAAVARPAVARRAFKSVWWATILLMAPVPATYRAARRRWDVWG